MNLAEIYRLLEKLKISGNDRTSLNPFLNILDAFSRLMGQSIYVVDYGKHEFVYVSSDPLFLCGYSNEEVLKMGYSFYQKALVEEDIQMFFEVDQKGYELFCSLPIEDRILSLISFDYRLKLPQNKTLMVNQKNTPIVVAKDGSIRFALCLVSLSTYDKPGHAFIRIDDVLQRYVYSLETRKWKKVEGITLTEREKEVLQLAVCGCSNEEIAQILFIDVSTVKFHKTKIYSKLNVKNINEAITFAYNSRLL